ncbi:MAG: YciI family protein [Candidatus Limnocylindrales bacterium]|jgi:uncharacterized protein YciI
MAGEMPDGLEIEQIWVVEATLGRDAAERRAPVRAEHLARIAALRDAGTVIEAGAFADMSASLLLMRVPTQQEALALAEADVYFRSGVWTGFRIRALGRVVRKGKPPAA